MTEFVSGLVGALIGGAFVVAGAWMQGRQHLAALATQFEQQRALAIEDHARQQTVIENERLRVRIDSQSEHGRKVMISAARFQSKLTPNLSEEERFDLLKTALAPMGLEWDKLPPYRSFVNEEDVEDPILRALLREHHEIVQRTEVSLGFADRYPDKLPPNCLELLDTTDSLARRFEARCRQLQREGSPI